MIFAGILIGVLMMAGMVYMALSKNSTGGIRIAALVALGLMVATVIVCMGIFLLSGKPPADESIVLITDIPAPPAKSSGDIIILIVFGVFLIGLFIMVTVISMKDRKKNAARQKTAALFIDDGDVL
jgi:hypothetical protein